MEVNREPDPEVTAETKLDEVDGGGTTYIMSVEIEKDIPRLGNCRQKLRSRDGLQIVDARNF